MSLLKDKIELEVQTAELKAKQAMETFPKTLRFFLIIAFLGSIPAYYVSKNLSESYYQKQYANLAITAKKSFENPEAPQISPVTITNAGNGLFGAAVKITNKNLNLSLPKASYQFSFYDSQKQPIYSETGQLFLLPNESKYIVAPRFSAKQQPAYANFSLTDSELHWENRFSITKVDLVTQEPNVYNQIMPQQFVAEGTYLNKSKYALSQVRLTFLILDRGGNIVGVSRRDDFSLKPGEQRSYKQIWSGLYADPAYKVKVFAESNPFEQGNLSSPSINTTPSPSSDLSRPE